MSCFVWLLLLVICAVVDGGIGLLVAGDVGAIIGAIVGVVISQAIQASATSGPKFPGDTNY